MQVIVLGSAFNTGEREPMTQRGDGGLSNGPLKEAVWLSECSVAVKRCRVQGNL